VAIAFVPGGEGRFFFTEKRSGRIRLFSRGLRQEPFAVAAVEDEGEQGMLGIALHPRYPEDPFVYVFYTRLIDRSNVVVRYRDSLGVGIDPKLIQIIPRQDDGTSNNGGGLHFGPDGMLYISIGDYGTNPADAQDIVSPRNYRGKILRLNPDGSTPADGPITGRPFWSYGHRNPTGFTFDEATGILYCVEGGLGIRNQVFAVPGGANLGWSADYSGSGATVVPFYTFPSGPQPGLTSILVYRGSGFPRLRGKFLLGGYANPTIWAGPLDAHGDSLVLEPFFRSNVGYADIEVAPDGGIVFTNGPYLSSRILKLTPVSPGFLSAPSLLAIERLEYTYTPMFSGTPPSLRLIEGPPGMVVDSSTWALRWTPTWFRATRGKVVVHIRAENGAGFADQRYTIEVVNVNDPPSPFALLEPADQAVGTFLGQDPEITFRWQPSTDPDGDTLRYRFQVDSTESFTGPGVCDTVVMADSVHRGLPKRTGGYFWRVTALDGINMTPAGSSPRRLYVSYVEPALARSEHDRAREAVLEQNFPNPFNPSTSIKYTLRRPGYVHLAVYNLLGQEVALLVDGVQPQGTYEAEFGKADLPSGIYFYRLQAPGVFETKKMVVTR
jgi:glucose/arabinose dehydrogenase